MTENIPITNDGGEELVRAARKAVEDVLTGRGGSGSPLDSQFDFLSGVFVTISKQGRLRGCIGFPLPSQRLSAGLVDAAVAAATQDPRFPPMTESELGEVTFEVTVLTEPEEIDCSGADISSMVRVGRDGLAVRGRNASGLLLPQVPVEHGWDAREFLSMTCRKAGLDGHAWKDGDIVVSRFQGIVFAEDAPGGNVSGREMVPVGDAK